MNQRLRSRGVTAARLRTAGFLVACLFYFRYRLDPQLLTHAGSVVRLFLFAIDPLWLREQFAMPAGPLVVASNWVGNWFFIPWLGPVVMTAKIAALMAIGQALADRLAGRRVAGVRFVPALLAVVIFNSQHFQLVVIAAAILPGLAAVGYLALPESRPLWRVLYAAAALPLLLIVTAGGFLIFLAVVVFAEWSNPQRRVIGLLAIVYGEALPFVFAVAWHERPVGTTYLDLAPISRIDGVVPLAVVLLWLVWPMMTLAVPRLAARELPPRPWGWPALAVAMLAAGWLGYDLGLAEILKYTDAVQRQDWPRVIAMAEAMPRQKQGPYSGYAYIRAKYETGRLGEDLFRITQSRYSLMAHSNPEAGIALVDLRAQSYHLLGDLTLQLGKVNEAEHDALEAIEIYGPIPEALVALSKVYLVKGWYEPAAIMIRNVRPVPGWRHQAEVLAGALVRLRAAAPATDQAGRCGEPVSEACPDPALPNAEVDAAVAEIERLRAVRQRIDRREAVFYFPEATTDLLRSNPSNRMAFEYLMAYYLLDARPDLMVEQFHWMPHLGYRRMPTLYQEAAVVVEALMGEPVDLYGYSIDPEVRQRFEQFLRTCGVDADELPALVRAGRNPSPELWQSFADTFFYYFVFDDSGLQP